MLASDTAGALDWGGRAIALAESLGEEEIVIHALNNVGAAAFEGGRPDGRAALEHSLAMAKAAGYEEHVARAYCNLTSIAVKLKQHVEVGAGDRGRRRVLHRQRPRLVDALHPRLALGGRAERRPLRRGDRDGVGHAERPEHRGDLAHPGAGGHGPGLRPPRQRAARGGARGGAASSRCRRASSSASARSPAPWPRPPGSTATPSARSPPPSWRGISRASARSAGSPASWRCGGRGRASPRRRRTGSPSPTCSRSPAGPTRRPSAGPR